MFQAILFDLFQKLFRLIIFYDQGFGISHVKDGKIKLINVDMIGDFYQNAFSVVRAFRLLRKQQFFKDLDKKNYIIWADCGKHFRCAEFISFLMKELAEDKIHVDLNFFGESHGKNSRDQHFSNVSNFLKQAEYKMRLTNTAEIIKAIEIGQRRANLFQALKRKFLQINLF